MDIKAYVAEYVTLLNKKDITTLCDKFYRDTSKCLPPDGTCIMGKTEICKMMTTKYTKKPATMKGTWKIEDTHGSGDCATTIGCYTITDGTKPIESGRLVTVWKMGPDGCKIQCDTFTTCPTPTMLC